MLNKIKRIDIQGNSDHITTLWPHPVISSILETKCVCAVQSVAKGCVPIEHSCLLPYDTQRRRCLGRNLGREHILTLFAACQLLFSPIQYAGVPIYFWNQSLSFYLQVAATLQLNFNPSVLLGSHLEYSCNHSWQANTLLFSPAVAGR